MKFLSEFLEKSPSSPLIVLIGPTASGKTAFSIALAKEMETLGQKAEIINADSRQFYKGLDIGTAKIAEKEMGGVPHHLLSVLEPEEPSTISWFKAEAEKIIGEIHARGHIPILVGGSMLYVSALVDGLEPLPPADPAIRERLSKEYDNDNGETLHRRLMDIDPETAASFPRQNKVYVLRALEIYESTGKTKSEQRRTVKSPYDLLLLGIDRPAEELKKRIADRTRAMLKGGWIDEVKRLRERGVKADAPAMKSIGYREIFEAIERGPIDQEALVQAIEKGTRDYAKRHRTWWKSDPRVLWITPQP